MIFVETLEDQLGFHQNDLHDEVKSQEFSEKLICHGWGSLLLDESRFQTVANWEDVFSKVFALPAKELKIAGIYRSVQGVSVGYRHDTERQFIECRMQSNNTANPQYETITEYNDTVNKIYDLLCEIVEMILSSIAAYLKLDKDVFVRLTDLAQRGRLPYLQHPPNLNTSTDGTINNDSEEDEESLEPTLSSSLLRICRYEGTLNPEEEANNNKTTANNQENHHNLAKFGAHTDTSFLTIGLTSSTPALDIFDPIVKEWRMAEGPHIPPNTVHIFLGEFLQVLTNQYIQASIHRVNNFAIDLPARISCPLIVRGRSTQTVHYNTDDEEVEKIAALKEGFTLPALEGVPMKAIHKILDFKRQKCFVKHGSEEGNWVLAAFPPVILPPGMTQ